MAGKPGRSGPKPGNKNALKNGSRIDRNRLTVGELPVSMISVKREARKYRRDLEAAVLAVKAEITVLDAHVIDAACGCTMAIGVNRWLLRNRLASMTVSDIVTCNREMRIGKKERAVIVRALNLDAPPSNPWAAIDVTPGGNEGDTDGED